MKNNLSIIDGDSIIYIACYSKERQKSYEEVFKTIDDILFSICDQCNTTKYVGFLSQGSFRYKLAKTVPYKGNRKDFIKPKYYKLAFAYMEEVLNFTVVNNWEADDLCTITASKQSIKDNYNPIICSPDKDLYQIEGTFYNYRNKELITVDKNQAEFNFWSQMLTGDVADNIKGINKIGPVRAKKLLESSDLPFEETVKNEYLKEFKDCFIERFNENYALLKLLTESDSVLKELNIQEIQMELDIEDAEIK